MKKPKKDYYTKLEIEGQSNLWVKTFQLIQENENLADFLKPLREYRRLNMVLTGAGTSAYIGEVTEHLFRTDECISARAIPTTTLVTHFNSYIDTSVPLLLISFARSGNSPESIATLDIAQSRCNDVYHIALTCNPSGKLAKKVAKLQNGLTVILPPESNDKGLAMTGSFTSLVLSSIYLANKWNGKNEFYNLQKVAEAAENVILSCTPNLKALSFKEFDRIVFLGSGPLLGMAKESHLKVQELTDGHVVGKFDSFLGFRHGPKAVVKKNTVIVFLFSLDKNVFRYEKDLVDEILQDGIAKHCLGVFCDKDQANSIDLDHKIVFDLDEQAMISDFHLLLYVIPAQIIGYYKSLNLGLNPDSPSLNNVISRVVKGVTIYPYDYSIMSEPIGRQNS